MKQIYYKGNDIAKVFIPLTQNLVNALWQPLKPQVFLGVMQQALHICICFFLLPFFSNHLKLCQWTIGGQPFIGFSKDV